MEISRIALQAALLTCVLLSTPVAGWAQSSTEVSKSTDTATSATAEATKKAEDKKGAVEKWVDDAKEKLKKKLDSQPRGGTASVRG